MPLTLNQETHGFLNNMPNNKGAEQSSEFATLALRSPSTAKTTADSPQKNIHTPKAFPDENKVWFRIHVISNFYIS